ncbi:lipid A-modifier LpxR family protein [Niabella insulamsoli]|uniref:lipid A-modifier LpxR family protein n=1 Tax=Niabella insulamsoli TaxID=3144874 RepID=UPI0031FBB615
MILFVFQLQASSAQHRHQFSIVSENDSYISINNDGYYTNGLKLSYQWQGKDTMQKSREKFNTIYAGHHIYNARFSGEIRTEGLDRPITGYLYAGYDRKSFNAKQDLLQWGLNAGVIGPPAYGAEVQELAHKVMQIYPPTYWDRQLSAAWGVNANLLWSPQLVKQQPGFKWDFKPLLSATAGTLFTNGGVGAALVYGKFNKSSRSAFWNNHKETSKSERELFVYLHPAVYFKAYDATVQGGMFQKEEEKIPGRLNPVFFQARLGAVYARKKIFFGATAIYENKQSLTQFSAQYYGSLKVGWMW